MSHAVTRGKATRTSAGSTYVIAAPGATLQLSLKSLIATIHTFAADGKLIIDDGTTEFLAWDATTVAGGQPPPVNFPDGYHWGKNKGIRLTTAGAIEVFVMAVAEVRGQ